MNLQYELQEGLLRVSLTGELGHHEAIRLMAQLNGLVEDHLPARMELDFSGLEFMDSSGIGFVMGRYKLIRSLDGELRIQGASARMEKVMRLAGLEKLPIWKG